MEMSLSLGTLITLILAVIAYIVWQVRNEGKLTAIQDLLKRIESEQAEMWKEFESHRLNVEIHFDKSHSRTVQENNEKEFRRIGDDIKEIKQMVRQLTERK